MQTMLAINLISSDPKIRRGRPCIAGTEVRVTDIIASTIYHRQTPDEIAIGYDLSLAQVYAALAFYYENKATLETDLREQIAKAEAYREAHLKNGGRSFLS